MNKHELYELLWAMLEECDIWVEDDDNAANQVGIVVDKIMRQGIIN